MFFFQGPDVWWRGRIVRGTRVWSSRTPWPPAPASWRLLKSSTKRDSRFRIQFNTVVMMFQWFDLCDVCRRSEMIWLVARRLSNICLICQGDRCHRPHGQRARRGGHVGDSGNPPLSHHLHVQAAQRAAGRRTHRRPNCPERPRVHPGQQHFQVQFLQQLLPCSVTHVCGFVFFEAHFPRARPKVTFSTCPFQAQGRERQWSSCHQEAMCGAEPGAEPGAELRRQSQAAK